MKGWLVVFGLLLGGEVRAQESSVDCSQPIEEVISALEAGPQLDLYLCVHRRQDAGEQLVSKLSGDVTDEGVGNRLSRGLAVWLLSQMDRAFTGEEIRALNPSDRNFLRVGIRARRGKESSCTVLGLESKECPHGEILQQFEWYRPQSGYSDRLLTDLDWTNLEMIKNPPPAPELEGTSSSSDQADASVLDEAEEGCSCANGGHQSLSWVLLLPLFVCRRRT